VSLRNFLELELEDLARAGLRRERPAQGGLPEGLLDICSNDYLGYAGRPVSRETQARAGAGASRLIHGTHPQHLALEAELCDWLGTESALLFPSGYTANLGALSALLRPEDLVVSDQLNHASLIDGCRLARARTVVVPHLDLNATDQALGGTTSGRKWVVTESYFSMDADSPDLPALRALCDRHGASLFIDEAHALGVFGPQGAGLAARDGVVPDVLMGAFGKAAGVQGAFVAGSNLLAEYLWNRARSFVFTTAPSPLLTEIQLARVRQVRRDDAARTHLLTLADLLANRLGRLGPGYLPRGRHGPVFPILLGSPSRALRAAAFLRSAGFLAQAIRPPTVPEGSSRLRVALHANLTEEDVERLAAALVEACAAS
jgi:8-amino-7-oxononanoate synthase